MTMAVLVTFALAGCGKEKTSPDQKLLDRAEIVGEYLDMSYEDTGYSVSKVHNGYKVNVDGEDIIIEKSHYDSEEKTNFGEIGELQRVKTKKAYDYALGKVKNYVLQSKVLDEKERIIEELDNLQIKSASGLDSVGLCEDGVVYINEEMVKKLSPKISRWCFVHELIHAVSDITHNGKKPFYASTLDESMTDIITASIMRKTIMSEEIADGYASDYFRFYEYTLGYISCFKDEALYAYYYGYHVIFDMVGKDEFNLFVDSFDQLDESDWAHVYVTQSLNKWRRLQKAG